MKRDSAIERGRNRMKNQKEKQFKFDVNLDFPKGFVGDTRIYNFGNSNQTTLKISSFPKEITNNISFFLNVGSKLCKPFSSNISCESSVWQAFSSPLRDRCTIEASHESLTKWAFSSARIGARVDLNKLV